MKAALRRQTADDRKRDAHEKIKLGGLVAKAGMQDEDATFLLGVLLFAAELRTDPKFRSRCIERGSTAMKAKEI